MTRQLELAFEGRGEAPSVGRSVETLTAPREAEGSGASGLMERVVSRPNMLAAYKRVRENKGSPGIDGLTVEELPVWLGENWSRIHEELLAGTYRPTPVRRQLIPKPGGGQRELGIPTVLDRLIQQALLRFSSRSSTRPSPITATGSGRDAGRTMPYGVRKDTSRRAVAGWWTWTWRRASTG